MSRRGRNQARAIGILNFCHHRSNFWVYLEDLLIELVLERVHFLNQRYGFFLQIGISLERLPAGELQLLQLGWRNRVGIHRLARRHMRRR